MYNINKHNIFSLHLMQALHLDCPMGELMGSYCNAMTQMFHDPHPLLKLEQARNEVKTYLT